MKMVESRQNSNGWEAARSKQQWISRGRTTV
jgi:hypothetical protein